MTSPPSSSPAPDTHREQRSQAVRRGAGFGLAARVISVSATLIQVPLALHYLGTDAYGLWMTLNSIAGLLTMADLGLSLGAKTLLSRAYGTNDPAACRSLADESFRQLLRLGAAVAVVGVALAWGIDWSHVFGPLLARQVADARLQLLGHDLSRFC